MRPAPTLLIAAFLFGGCDRPPGTDLRQWTPIDHDRAEETLGAQSKGRGAAKDDPTALIEMAWQARCTRCHGPYGRGDGPDGPTIKARDLTDEDWQSKVTDAELVTIIRNGKGKMPKFDGPPALVDGLVARIRATRGLVGTP